MRIGSFELKKCNFTVTDTVVVIDEDKISLYFLINASRGEETVSSDRSY